MLRREYVGRVTGHSLVAAWDLLPMRGGEARATPLRQKFWFANATRGPHMHPGQRQNTARDEEQYFTHADVAPPACSRRVPR